MASKKEGSAKKSTNKGAWTVEEDRKLSQFIETHGPRRWKTVAIKSGLNRCGKSCRLRWLNYLRPNIKRGNISEAEEDLIIRLHKLLGNRWSLIAGRLPGRTDNEIKNYWNSHLSKKINQQTKDLKTVQSSTAQEKITYLVPSNSYENNNNNLDQQLVDDQLEATTIEGSSVNLELKDEFDMNDLFDFSVEVSPCGLDWVNKFFELDVDLLLSNDAKR